MAEDRFGVVFLDIDNPAPDNHGYSDSPLAETVSGYWDRRGHSDGNFAVMLPEGMSIEEAIAWGRERSSQVRIKNSRPSFPAPLNQPFHAGDEPTLNGDLELSLIHI